MVGVGVAGRPVGRGLDDGVTMEVTRTCTTGAQNANSMIYGALCRASQALGYQRVVTYTLAEEDGGSLRAAGFVLDEELDARPAWDYTDQARVQVDIFGEERRPPGAKKRWIRIL